MAQYLVADTDLESVADSIRAKTGSTEPLVFPDGFNNAISEIQSGGGATEPYVEETYDSSGNLIEAKLYGHTATRKKMFYGSTCLTSVILPNGIKKIEYDTFYSCSNLVLKQIPDSIEVIDITAFASCGKLKLQKLPNSLKTIETSAFNGCAALEISIIPFSVETIGGFAFNFCYAIDSITFEGTPISINEKAFNGCTNLTTINVPWAEGAVANAPWGATNATINYNYTGA